LKQVGFSYRSLDGNGCEAGHAGVTNAESLSLPPWPRKIALGSAPHVLKSLQTGCMPLALQARATLAEVGGKRWPPRRPSSTRTILNSYFLGPSAFGGGWLRASRSSSSVRFASSSSQNTSGRLAGAPVPFGPIDTSVPFTSVHSTPGT